MAFSCVGIRAPTLPDFESIACDAFNCGVSKHRASSDLDVPSGRRFKPLSRENGGRDSSACRLLAQALSSSSCVDFPTVTEICQVVHDDPPQTVAVAEVLASAMRKGNDTTLQLKAATVAHELLYDGVARRAMFENPGLLQALDRLRVPPAAKDGPVEEIVRVLTTEVMKRLLKEFCLEL